MIGVKPSNVFLSSKSVFTKPRKVVIHCHDKKTAAENKSYADGFEGIGDNDYVIEEPCEFESLTHGFEEKVYG